MIAQLGLAFIVIWAGNLMWMIYQVVRHTPNWRDKDVDINEIMTNFVTNTTQEQLEMIRRVSQVNPMMGMSGVMLLLMAWIL
jgi:hypothetical protein